MTQLQSNRITVSKIVKAVTFHPRLITFALTHPKEEVVLQHERLEALRLAPSAPFHGDPTLQQIILASINYFHVQTFFETGTFRGDSILWLSQERPDLDIMSVEVDQYFHNYASKRVSHLESPNKVRLFNNDSTVVLKECFNARVLLEPTLFWLDAHWYNNWPLLDEITQITRSCQSSIVLIDDFKVPNNSELGYDTYNGAENSIELIRPILENSSAHSTDLLYPKYRFSSEREGEKSNQRGYVGIYLGLRKLFDEFLIHNQGLTENFIHEVI